MTSGHVQTLANSIIGTAILAMPYCFAKCGVILSIFLLIISTIITRSCCHYLIKASIVTRRRTMEQLGFHMFGPAGKTMVEISVIGFLMGTCVAFFVVIGDLSPQIISKIFNLKGFSHDSVRNFLIVLVTIAVVVPLCFQKSIESLSLVCRASIGFYICLTIKTVFESFEKFETDENWSTKIELWNSAGVLQCIPIFSMSMSCQMQLFEVYESMPGSFDRIKRTVHQATLICCIVYCVVGFFGYLAFYDKLLSGNVLMNFSPSLANDAITIGFILSIACSFPLVIFPCRTSLASFLQRKSFHTEIAAYVPESKYQPLTLFIIFSTMILGILIPSVEVIISLVGSTIGILVCVVFPATCFVKIMKRSSLEKTFAQVIIVCGIIIMILGTYANLVAIETAESGTLEADIAKFQEVKIENRIEDVKLPVALPQNMVTPGGEKIDEKKEIKIENEKVKEIDEKIKKNNEKGNENDEKIGKNDENNKKLDIKDGKIEKPNKDPAETDKNPELKLPDEVIKKEEQEIAVNQEILQEKTKDPQMEIKEKNEEIEELKESKNKLEKEVQEMKEVLVKQNKETQDLVLQKFEEIAEKVEKIEKKTNDDENEKIIEKKKLKEEVKAAAEVVKASLEEKAQEAKEQAEKIEEKAEKFEEKIEEIKGKIEKKDEKLKQNEMKMIKNDENLIQKQENLIQKQENLIQKQKNLTKNDENLSQNEKIFNKNQEKSIKNKENSIENNEKSIKNKENLINDNEKLEKVNENLKNEVKNVRIDTFNEKKQEIDSKNQQIKQLNNDEILEINQISSKDSFNNLPQVPIPNNQNQKIPQNPSIQHQSSDLNLLEVEISPPKPRQNLENMNLTNKKPNPEVRVDPIVKLIKSQEPLSYQVGEKMMENKKINVTNQETSKNKLESAEIKNEMRRKREVKEETLDELLGSIDKKMTNFEVQSIMTRDLKAADEKD